jgi:hypothetical protein
MNPLPLTKALAALVLMSCLFCSCLAPSGPRFKIQQVSVDSLSESEHQKMEVPADLSTAIVRLLNQSQISGHTFDRSPRMASYKIGTQRIPFVYDQVRGEFWPIAKTQMPVYRLPEKARSDLNLILSKLQAAPQ